MIPPPPSSPEETARTTSAPNIKAVPADPSQRRMIRRRAQHLARTLPPHRPPGQAVLEERGRALLQDLDLDDAFLGFAMVAVSNAFWRRAFTATPCSRRLLLLPQCLRNAAACRGTFDAEGLHCVDCCSCRVSRLRKEAESLGYSVIIAEGTPVVVREILSGRADALLGVACLDSLEKTFQRAADLGVPHVAIPLLTDGCHDTEVDLPVVRRWLRLERRATGRRTRSFVPLLRATEALFDDETLNALLADCFGHAPLRAPESVESIALEWLRAGGKRFRPFITLAAYGAAAWGADALHPDAVLAARIPEAVKRIAVAIEILHKASLLHDDIEDADAYRYGRATLHRRHGVPTAINVGDYLIGLGYRLVASSRLHLGAERTADILACLSDAHLRLCRGQGAEFQLMAEPARLRLEEVQRVYALKTAPAFEAALQAGLVAARDGRRDEPIAPEHLRRYCRLVGVGYQLLNDLKDWNHSGRPDAGEAAEPPLARPTLLCALALESADETARLALHGLHQRKRLSPEAVRRRRDVYLAARAFDRAEELLNRYRRRALALADTAASAPLREVLRFIVETVL